MREERKQIKSQIARLELDLLMQPQKKEATLEQSLLGLLLTKRAVLNKEKEDAVNGPSVKIFERKQEMQLGIIRKKSLTESSVAMLETIGGDAVASQTFTNHSFRMMQTDGNQESDAELACFSPKKVPIKTGTNQNRKNFGFLEQVSETNFDEEMSSCETYRVALP